MAEKYGRWKREKGQKILILGASGFIGNALYKEFCNYFDTYGTFYSNTSYRDNQQFFRYDLDEDDIISLLKKIKPNYIISALRGNFSSQILAHELISQYVLKNECRVYFISSANVFDAYSKYPSYENDKTLSESIYGRLKIKIENMVMRLPQRKSAILRIPMVFGNASPRIKEIKTALNNNEPIEVFPNLIINVTNENHLSQQLHYLVNRNKTGVFHLGSYDLVQHEEFIKEVIKRLGNYHPVLKRVYTTNENRYLAVLPKENKLPKNHSISYQEVIDHHFLVD